jgi:cyclo(L-tyrosyl-L-tyrosyl) synthase
MDDKVASLPNPSSGLEVKMGLDGAAFERGYQILQDKTHATLIPGMSLGNKYFSQEVIQEILEYLHNEHFGKVLIFIPDVPAIHNFIAAGMEPKKAKARARRDANALKGRCKRSIERLGGNTNINNKFIIINWEKDIATHPAYASQLLKIQQLYQSSYQFKEDIRSTTQEVLSSKNLRVQTEDALEEAIHFLIEELSSLLVLSEIFRDEKNLCFVYHRRWPIFEKLVAGFYDGTPKTEDIGFLVISKK